MATVVSRKGGLIRRAIKAIEPWYNWGRITVERMDELEETQIGRTPKRTVRS